jgi:nucleotide-binding universal stress UspA family protein
MLGTRILVPLDGGPIGEAALPYAEALARRTGGTLALVRAAHAAALHTDQSRAQADAIDQAETYLRPLAAQLIDRGLSVETGVPYGTAAYWIVEEIALRNADLVVMATHDRSGADRWLRGSVAEAVVSHAPVPVLVVRAEADQHVERFELPHPVLLVPLDGSDLAEAALPAASSLAAALGATMVLVSVVPSPGQLVYAEGAGVPVGEYESDRLRRDAEYYLAATAGRLGNELVTSTLVRLGDPATEIAQLANELRAAAVVMATHGRTGLSRVLFGSITGRVVHTGQTPVVLVRPANLRPAEASQSTRFEPAAVTP